jgi:hypothetical protein
MDTAGRSGVPWQPAGLPAAAVPAEVDGWRYVVVEEIVDAVAVLRRWRWPLADERGHLVWPAETQEDATTVPVALLQAQLYTPNGIQRAPRVGDAFAVVAPTAAARWPARTRDLRTVLAGSVFDVSAEARIAARLAYHGSLAAVRPAPGDLGTARGLAAENRDDLRAPGLTLAAPPRRPGEVAR